MDETQDIIQPESEPVEEALEPSPPIQSRFLFVDVAALRAKQLRRGARLRIPDDPAALPLPHKAERLAMEEVRRGLVQYQVASPKKGAAAGETEA